ncbi:MAG: hypothetical protein R3B91_08840 [Planctomycetaceae bacterium]
MIYPNPLNPKRYVVVNSGHTMHENDFRSSNAWLFPRLGDIAVQRYERQADGSYQEETVWADLFDTAWNLPGKYKPKRHSGKPGIQRSCLAP